MGGRELSVPQPPSGRGLYPGASRVRRESAVVGIGLLLGSITGIVSVPGIVDAGATIPAGGVVRIHATDIGGQAIAGNLTVTGTAAPGFATVFPCTEGLPSPLTSNINFVANDTVANFFIAKSDANGDICVTPNAATHIIVDQVLESGSLQPHNAIRKIDTREIPSSIPGIQLISQDGGPYLRPEQFEPTCRYQDFSPVFTQHGFLFVSGLVVGGNIDYVLSDSNENGKSVIMGFGVEPGSDGRVYIGFGKTLFVGHPGIPTEFLGQLDITQNTPDGQHGHSVLSIAIPCSLGLL